MKVKDFKFSDQDFKSDVVRENNIREKNEYAFDYLLNHLPINELNKDGNFNFDEVKFDEGKNYDWFFLKNQEVTILIRQYSGHFTFYCKHNSDRNGGLNVLTISDDYDLMPDELNDSYVDDRYLSIKEYLPKLVDLIKRNRIGTIWNSHTFPVKDFTKVKVGYTNTESVTSLDITVFATDEICSKFLSVYAENEILESLSKYSVGDMFGDYKITQVKDFNGEKTEDTYYHDYGLKFTNTNFPDSEDESWADIYSLARYYSDELNDEQVKKEEAIKLFMYQNHSEVINLVIDSDILESPIGYLMCRYKYCQILYNLYGDNDINYDDFEKFIIDEYEEFIRLSIISTLNKREKEA